MQYNADKAFVWLDKNLFHCGGCSQLQNTRGFTPFRQKTLMLKHNLSEVVVSKASTSVREEIKSYGESIG